jgi:hypothetical protein
MSKKRRMCPSGSKTAPVITRRWGNLITYTGARKGPPDSTAGPILSATAAIPWDGVSSKAIDAASKDQITCMYTA